MSAPSPEDEVELHIVFDYVIQRVPTRTNRAIQMRKEDFNVYLKLKRKNLDANGFPKPLALWYAERMFLKGFGNKHLPNVRLMQWEAKLKDNPKVLSEYRVLLSASLD